MAALVLKNEKEKLFLENLIISEDVYNSPEVKTQQEFRHLMTYRNHQRSWGLTDANNEVEDNLLLLVNRDARVAYLKRLIKKIELKKMIQQKRIELLNSEKDDQYQFVLNYPKQPQVIFSISRKAITHNIKSSLAYLQMFEISVSNQLEIEGYIQSNKKQDIRYIFQNGYFEKCIPIMTDLEIIDSGNKNILTVRTGYKLFAFIDAINDVSLNKKILVKIFSVDELVLKFNTYLGTNYQKHNRPTKKEKSEGKMKGYFQCLKDAKALIKKI
jgi:hypothetical protein